ncbi:MAG: CoA transferase [Verrucomicrobia bacterium]|nr:CoA transferase [Verrucomicrobiota bacterium]
MTDYAHKSWNPTAKGPLHGIRVLDLSRLVAGNMLSLQLADFGADVIKIEPPAGDPLREWKEAGQSLYWKTYSRNKRSVALNLRADADRAAFWALIRQADVLIENFRPGTLEDMGYGPDQMLVANPGLIVTRISGFGQTGPYASLPGFGTLVEAMSGFAHRTGFSDREPVLPPLALADMIAGMQGAFAVVTALFARQRGEVGGQVIDLSLLEPMFSTLGPEVAIYDRTGRVRERVGSASNTSCPRNVYCCADGHFVALSGSTPAVARRIFETIGRSDMNDDPRFATNSDRLRNREAVEMAIGAWFATRDRDEALSVMRKAGATVGPVYSIADIAQDAHFREREVIVALDDADYGSLPMHGIGPRLSETPGNFRRPAPTIGEHTVEVLSEAGVEASIIARIMGPDA